MRRFSLLLVGCISLSFTFNSFAKVAVMVEADWLKTKINDKSIVIVDMSDGLQYQRFHIKNAVHLAYGEIVRKLKNGVSLRVSDQKLYKVLGAKGIKPDHHVVIYDDMGGYHAGRLFWELERIGHKNVSVLNGGLVQWILNAYPIENRVVHRNPTVYRANKDHQKIANEIDLKGILAIDFKKTQLIDVRSRLEYQGSKKDKKSGHIPGAKWWSWDNSIDLSKGFRHRENQILINQLKKIGVEKSVEKLVVYCRSGHRAGQTYLTLRKLGFKNIKLYDGSILEYTRNPNVVLKIGMQP